LSDNSNYFPITHWNESDRPREKYLSKGKDSLSDAELIAIIIGSGSRNESAVTVSQKLLQKANNQLTTLSHWTTHELMQINGIGVAKALALGAAIELGKRQRAETPQILDKIESSQTVFQLLYPQLGDLPHEEFWIIYLNNSNRVLSKIQLSKGGITATLVDTRLVFKKALQQGAVAVILIHNHPSGTLKPSESDRKLTQKIVTAGEQLDIKVLDHVIITSRAYFSFADEGLL
jgi:DNA repair protein RadC